jgi:murein DD-endopeptidase MepM/ murein hydrolase activator NlpD
VQRLIDQARQQLGSAVADGLSTVRQLADAMNQNANQQTQLQNQIDASQAKIDSLNNEIQQLDDQISQTQDQIDTERSEIGILARYLYVQPDALLLRLLRAGSVRDMVTQTSDLTAAALRADSLEQKLNSDLAKQQQDEADRQQAAEQEQAAQDQLNSAMSQLQDLQSQEQDSSDQLQSAIDNTQQTLDGLGTQGSSVTQDAIDMLIHDQQQLIATAEQEVWQQAELWATLNSSALPPPPATTLGGTQSGPAGTVFAWPIQGAVLTQGFGPSTLSIEPAMFGFPHFHTGLDLASPATKITAAADGVVAAVGQGNTGYGNYVIIAHGGGLVTLYGHLSLTMATVGETVTQGQQIGVEGSTGNSTGVHLHFEVRVNGTPVDPSPYLPPLTGA